jgi:hypothetical protein
LLLLPTAASGFYLVSCKIVELMRFTYLLVCLPVVRAAAAVEAVPATHFQLERRVSCLRLFQTHFTSTHTDIHCYLCLSVALTHTLSVLLARRCTEYDPSETAKDKEAKAVRRSHVEFTTAAISGG